VRRRRFGFRCFQACTIAGNGVQLDQKFVHHPRKLIRRHPIFPRRRAQSEQPILLALQLAGIGVETGQQAFQFAPCIFGQRKSLFQRCRRAR
jgi:hypothetical protein